MEQDQKPSESEENYIKYFLLAFSHTVDNAFKAKEKLDTVCFKTAQWDIIRHPFASQLNTCRDIAPICLKWRPEFGDQYYA